MSKPSVEFERRQLIISATRQVMVTRGLNQLRIADVAKAAKLSSGIIHYYFATKEDLVRETFEQSFDESLRRREKIFERDLPAGQRLVALIDSYIPRDEVTIEAWHVWLQLWAGALRDEGLCRINEIAYEKWRNLISIVILEGHAVGTLTSSDPEGAANALVALIDGLAVQVLLQSPTIDAKMMSEICTQFLRSSLDYHD